MEMTRVYFFIREKAVKTWGLTGQNGGRGEFFVVPHCALQPHYGGGTTDACVSVYCSLCFFSLVHSMYISVIDLQCSLLNKVFLN